MSEVHPPGVVVIGPFRSGTSLVCGLLAGLGVTFGPASAISPPPDRYNSVGYFQRPDIVSANTRYIQSASSTLFDTGSPERLARQGDRRILADLPLSWRDSTSTWGIKDPRLCATLAAWLAAGCIQADRCKLVRVTRSIDAVARSVIGHREVRQYCDADIGSAREMSQRYDEYALWHEKNVGMACHQVSYERLIADPFDEVSRLADHIGMRDDVRIGRCAKLIGKRRAQVHHYLRKVTHPSLLATTVRKTLRGYLKKTS